MNLASTPISIAILHNDDPRVSEIAQRIQQDFSDITILANVTSWSALLKIDALPPVIILDAELDDGVLTTERIREIRARGSRVISVSTPDTPRSVIQFMAAGADAALGKKQSTHRLVTQIRLASSRGRLIESRAHK